MKKNFVVFPALALGLAAFANAQAPATAAPSGPPPTKVAIISAQQAVMATKDGQKASAEMNVKFTPRKNGIEKKQSDIAAQQDQMKKGSATMNDEAKTKLAREIDANQKSLQRDMEDFEADVQQEEQKIMQDLGQKIMDVVIKYAAQNGYAVVLDVSNQQTPVLWADPSADITSEIIKLYDQAHPGTGTTASPATAKPATNPPAGAPKPPANPPATKK